MYRNRRRFSPSPPECAFLSPAFNACALSTPEVDAALLRYRQSRRSPIGNLLTAPMEEDVLVMDGVLVNRDDDSSDRLRGVSFGGGMRRNRSADDMVCRSWEEFGSSRFGTKCQYAHGKEQVRGHRMWKQKAEDILGQRSGKPSPRSAGSFTYGGSKIIAFIAQPSPNYPCNIPSPTSASPPAFGPTSYPRNERDTLITASGSSSEPSSFNWPPTEDEEAYITRVLYGPSSRCRLPCFEEICPQ